MTDLMAVAILWVPPVRMSPNQGTPTRTMKRLRATAKEAACLAIRSSLRGERIEPYDGPVHFTFTVYWPKGRHTWDDDNLSSAMKGIQDAFEAEGIIANDKQADNATIIQGKDDGQGFVYVEIVTRQAAEEQAA